MNYISPFYADVITYSCHNLDAGLVNSLRLGQNGCHFTDSIFKCISLNENVWILIKKFVPRGPVNNIPALVQIMAWCRLGNKPLSEPMMVSLVTHICTTWSQWVNPKRMEKSMRKLATIWVQWPNKVHEMRDNWEAGLNNGVDDCSNVIQKWPRQDGRHLADNIFKCIFLIEKARISVIISLKFVPNIPINKYQHYFT